jgi:hypothetical protein
MAAVGWPSAGVAKATTAAATRRRSFIGPLR